MRQSYRKSFVTSKYGPESPSMALGTIIVATSSQALIPPLTLRQKGFVPAGRRFRLAYSRERLLQLCKNIDL